VSCVPNVSHNIKYVDGNLHDFIGPYIKFVGGKSVVLSWSFLQVVASCTYAQRIRAINFSGEYQISSINDHLIIKYLWKI
jgi:hypothetical protein